MGHVPAPSPPRRIEGICDRDMYSPYMPLGVLNADKYLGVKSRKVKGPSVMDKFAKWYIKTVFKVIDWWIAKKPPKKLKSNSLDLTRNPLDD